MKQHTIKQRERSYKALLQIAKKQNDTKAIAYYEKILRLVQVSNIIENDYI